MFIAIYNFGLTIEEILPLMVLAQMLLKRDVKEWDFNVEMDDHYTLEPRSKRFINLKSEIETIFRRKLLYNTLNATEL